MPFSLATTSKKFGVPGLLERLAPSNSEVSLQVSSQSHLHPTATPAQPLSSAMLSPHCSSAGSPPNYRCYQRRLPAPRHGRPLNKYLIPRTRLAQSLPHCQTCQSDSPFPPPPLSSPPVSARWLLLQRSLLLPLPTRTQLTPLPPSTLS